MSGIIAVDFDGVLCEDAWPQIGEPIPHMIEAAKLEKRQGAALILWTCRCGDRLSEAIEWCRHRGILFDAINENLPERVALYGTESRKISADEYWDDRATPLSSVSLRYLVKRDAEIAMKEGRL